MGNVFTPGPYPHNPFVGDRPMKYPYTMGAKIAQFPFVYHWRYMLVSKAAVCSFLFGIPVFYKLQQLCKFNGRFSTNNESFLYFSTIFCDFSIYSF